MNCGTLSRLRQAAGLLALSKFATLAPQQYNCRADSYLVLDFIITVTYFSGGDQPGLIPFLR